MTEQEREEVALFRFGVIGELAQTAPGRGEKARLLARKSRTEYRWPGGREGRHKTGADCTRRRTKMRCARAPSGGRIPGLPGGPPPC